MGSAPGIAVYATQHEYNVDVPCNIHGKRVEQLFTFRNEHRKRIGEHNNRNHEITTKETHCMLEEENVNE